MRWGKPHGIFLPSWILLLGHIGLTCQAAIAFSERRICTCPCLFLQFAQASYHIMHISKLITHENKNKKKNIFFGQFLKRYWWQCTGVLGLFEATYCSLFMHQYCLSKLVTTSHMFITLLPTVCTYTSHVSFELVLILPFLFSLEEMVKTLETIYVSRIYQTQII